MQNLLDQLSTRLNAIILGKSHQINLALACIFADGHLLIEDLPGMGKTTLAHSLTRVLGLDFQRIQFTSDLLPADILGASIYNKSSEAFQFMPGPLFHQVILADEINRASPKAQSALLEAMEERQVTVDGTTYGLPKPFFVIATQNPQHQGGTYPLPESQLDRFLMKISLGYPSPHAERQLLEGKQTRQDIDALTPILSATQLLKIQRDVMQVTCSTALLDYVQRIISFTRETPELSLGLSPRGSLSLIRAAKAWAYLHQRGYVLPEDVLAVLEAVITHRLKPATSMHMQQIINLLREKISPID